MRALFGHGDAVAGFVAAQLGYSRGFGECQAIGFLDAAGVLEAGVVYHNWQPEADVIEISAASLHRRWTTRARVALVFGYPFGQIGAQMLVARISEHNALARRMWRRLGAQEYVIPRLRGRDEAECVCTLTAEAWEQYEGRHGQAESA